MGWNFTLSRKRDSDKFDISIPNGMEFYTLRRYLWPHSQRFNSQRDGILPLILIIFPFKIHIFVSIPNGMEFYLWRFKASLQSLRVSIPNGMEFYSADECARVRIVKVSIPNGMEFYAIDTKLLRHAVLFQFPTGWNSTGPKNLAAAITAGFNSQRDGILHRDCNAALQNEYRFQFPTGWNSTIQYERIENVGLAFQFPAGWNSTWKPPRFSKLPHSVSIPNGMEFYVRR